MIVALLLACTGPVAVDRELRVVDDSPPSATGSSGPIADVEACEVAEGSMVLDWCVRISPEAGTILDNQEDLDPTGSGAGTVHAGAGSTAGPPCGVTNLVGALGVGGDPASPVALYCDADRTGGMRFVRYSPESGQLTQTMLATRDCSPVPGSGALAAIDGGWLAAWASTADPTVEPLAASDAPYGVVSAVLDSSGSLVATPTRIDVGDDVGHVAVATGTSALAVAVTWGGEVWAVPLPAPGALGVVTSPPKRITSGAVEAAIAATEAGFIAATCGEDPDVLTLWSLDEGGKPLASTIVTGAACGWAQRPALARYADGVVLGWTGAAGPGAAAFSGDLSERWRYIPTAGGTQVAPLSTGVLVLSLDGTVARLDDAGEVIASAVHPALVGADGALSDLRVSIAGERALFLAYGSSNYPIGGGHVNTFNFVELSAAPLP